MIFVLFKLESWKQLNYKIIFHSKPILLTFPPTYYQQTPTIPFSQLELISKIVFLHFSAKPRRTTSPMNKYLTGLYLICSSRKIPTKSFQFCSPKLFLVSHSVVHKRIRGKLKIFNPHLLLNPHFTTAFAENWKEEQFSMQRHWRKFD